MTGKIISPLRYPGGKTRAVKELRPYIPNNVDVICSPFLGGGSFELALSMEGIHIYGYDIFLPLVNFWQKLLSVPIELAKEVEWYFPLAKFDFYELQKKYFTFSDVKAAAVFYVLNRASFSGTTLSGGMSPGHPRFTAKAITKLREFKVSNFQVDCVDFEISIAKHGKDFLYCDPPYMNGESLYGNKGNTHNGFNHIRLYEILRARDKWILSYNDCDEIRHLYQNYEIVQLQWAYGMGKQKSPTEILILSG